MEEKQASCVYRIRLITPEGERSVFARADEHLWDAAQSAGVVLPALCHQGRCLSCAGRLVAEGEFDQGDSEAYFPADRHAGFILLCTAKALSDLCIQTGAAEAMRAYRLSLGLPAPYS